MYYWTVRAKYLLNNEETYTEWFGNWNFLTIDTIIYLSKPNIIYPQNGIMNSGRPEKINFRWNYVLRANSYQFQMASDTGFNNIITDQILTDTVYQYPQLLESNTTVYWRIKALTKSEVEIFKHSDWSDTRYFTTNYEFTTYPELLSPVDNSINMPPQVTLEWTPLPNAVSYRVRILYLDNYIWGEFPDEIGSITNSCVFNFTKPNSRYQWIVYAVSPNGTCSDVAPLAFQFTTGNFANGTTPPIAPPNGANFESSNAYVEWTANPNAESYRFQLAQQSAFMPKVLIAQNMLFSENSTIVMDTIITNHSINLSLNGIDQTYYWRVYTNLKNGDSTCWTDYWKFTVNATNFVETNQTNLNIQVYTNDNLLTVKQLENYFEQANFEIYNMSGEMIKDLGILNFNTNSIEFNINNLTSGQYWLRISSDKYIKYFNFVLMR